MLKVSTRSWIFYIASIITAAIAILLLTIGESRPSLLLAHEVDLLKLKTGIDSLKALNPDKPPNLRMFLKINVLRPLRLIFTEPIVFSICVMLGTALGIIYLFTEALPHIYEDMGLNKQQSSLPFFAIGFAILLNIPGRIIDHRAANKKDKADHLTSPEYKLKGLTFAAPVLALGLWWFAWTIPPMVEGVHWTASLFSLFAIGYGRNELAIVLAGYVADCYLSYSSGVFAGIGLTRAIMSAMFPLFAPQMFKSLGSNFAVSVLAGAMTVFSVLPFLFRRYGKWLRERSRFAQYSVQVYKENTVESDDT